MKVSSVQENMARKLYLGVENFYPVAVNPTMQELIDMGIPATEEPEYVSKIKRDYGDGEKEYDQVTVRIFLDNMNPTDNIKTQVTYKILKDHHFSTTGKYLVINKYGGTTWLEEPYIGAAALPANMQWYVNEGVKKAYRREEDLIKFIKALRNLPNVNQKSSQDVKDKGIAMFEQQDLDALFAGNFTGLRNVILSPTDEQKVGFMLGVRDVEGDFKQTVFSSSPQRAYIKSTGKSEWLVKDIRELQARGLYSDSIFDLDDTSLKVFDPNKHAVTADAGVGGYEDDDDLPF